MQLPEELISHCLAYLGTPDLVTLNCVCKTLSAHLVNYHSRVRDELEIEMKGKRLTYLKRKRFCRYATMFTGTKKMVTRNIALSTVLQDVELCQLQQLHVLESPSLALLQQCRIQVCLSQTLQELVIDGSCIRAPEMLGGLFQFHWPRLRTLKIEGGKNMISEQMFRRFKESRASATGKSTRGRTRNFPVLEELILHRFSFDDERLTTGDELRYILAAVHLPQLSVLDICGSWNGMMELRSALAEDAWPQGTHFRLKKLVSDHAWYEHRVELKHNSEALATVCNRFSSLTELSCSCMVSVGDLSPIGKLSMLERLYITCCSTVTDEQLIPVLRSCPELQVLKADHCYKLTDAIFHAGRKLREIHMSGTHVFSLQQIPPDVEVLSLRDVVTLTDSAFEGIEQRAARIHTLTLDGCCSLTDKIVLYASRLSYLHTLSLFGLPQIRGMGWDLNHTTSTLKFLNVSGCYNLKVDASPA